MSSIDHKLTADEIDVDLDTFAEAGQMHYWNNIGKRIPLDQDDKPPIPAARLHGSAVVPITSRSSLKSSSSSSEQAS